MEDSAETSSEGKSPTGEQGAPSSNAVPTCLHVSAAEWRRRLDPTKNEQGSAEAQVFADADGNEYLCKATNNPQGGKVVVNDVVGGLALEWLGVLHPQTAIVNVPQAVIDNSPGAKFGNGQAFAAGDAFGCPYWTSEPDSVVRTAKVTNLRDVAGAVVLDTWLANGDSRQFRGKLCSGNERKFQFFPVDQGHCIAHNWGEGLTVGSPVARDPPYPLEPSGGPEFAEHVHQFAAKLDSFTDTESKHIVNEVPATWLSAAERAALTTYLLQRAPLAATALRAKYPLQVQP
jgi:hypothetical protein